MEIDREIHDDGTPDCQVSYLSEWDARLVEKPVNGSVACRGMKYMECHIGPLSAEFDF